MNKTIGLVLAGGLSSRMGQDKVLLLWQGVPLYRHMQQILTRAGVTYTLISRNTTLDSKSVTLLQDKVPNRRPLSSIHAAVQKVQDGVTLLITPVDMPLLPVTACKKLIQSITDNTSFYFKGYPLPAAIPVDQTVRSVIQRLIQNSDPKDYALKRLFQGVNARTISLPVDMTDCFHNTNTPAKWESAKHIQIR